LKGKNKGKWTADPKIRRRLRPVGLVCEVLTDMKRTSGKKKSGEAAWNIRPGEVLREEFLNLFAELQRIRPSG
jgi:hypothetical protein